MYFCQAYATSGQTAGVWWDVAFWEECSHCELLCCQISALCHLLLSLLATRTNPNCSQTQTLHQWLHKYLGNTDAQTWCILQAYTIFKTFLAQTLLFTPGNNKCTTPVLKNLLILFLKMLLIYFLYVKIYWQLLYQSLFLLSVCE